MARNFTDLAVYNSVESRKVLNDSKRASREVAVTPELADQFGKAYILGRYASPELIASAAVAGISNLDDLYTNLQSQLYKQGVVPQRVTTSASETQNIGTQLANAKPGDKIVGRGPNGEKIIFTFGTTAGAPTAAFTAEGDQRTGAELGLRMRTKEEIAAEEKRRTELEKRVPVVNLDTATGRYSLRGMQGAGGFREGLGPMNVVTTPLQAVGLPLHFTGQVLGWMAPDFVEPVAQVARGFTKGATLVLSAGAEIPYNYIQLALRDAYIAGQTDGNAWERFRMATRSLVVPTHLISAVRNTTLVQTGADILSGEGADFGGGWFASGKTGERAHLRQADTVGTYAEAKAAAGRPVYVSPDDAWLNRTITPGGLGAEALVDAKLVERDSEAYQFFNDLFETGVIIGLDINNYWNAPHALIKRFNLNPQIAAEYVNARKAGKLEEALRIEAENGLDAEVARKLTDQERQNAVARNVFEQQDNVVYSGDRSFETGKTIESFVDIDDPNFVPNTQNLFGEGLYVTDQAFVASTEGYNKEGALTWDDFTPEQIDEVQALLPEGARLTKSGLNKGSAGVWKFDTSNLNIIDGEARLSPEIKQIVDEAFVNSSNEATRVLRNRDATKFKELRDAVTQSKYITAAGPPDPTKFRQLTAPFVETVKRVFGFDQPTAERFVQEYVDLSIEAFYKFGDEFDVLNRNGETLNNLYINNLSKLFRQNVPLSGKALPPLQDIENVLTKYGFGVGADAATKLERLQMVSGLLGGEFISIFADNPLFNKLRQPTTENLLSTVGKELHDWFTATSSPEVARTATNPVLKALVDAGYDGVSYNGGQRIGGASQHTATVIWKPSKLQHVDILSGEKFPINQAVSALESARRSEMDAWELDYYRNNLNEIRSTYGLIDEAPRSLEPTNLNNVRFTPQGKQMLQRLADENDPVVIWRTWLKGKSPNAAIRLAEAKTPEEVFKVLEDAVYSSDPNMNLRTIPYNGWKDWVSDTGFKVKQNVDKYSKQTSMMPDSTYIPFDDPAMALQRAERVMQVTGIPIEQRDLVLRSLFDAIKQDTSKAWDNFFETANKQAIIARMRKAGMDEQSIRDFTSYRWKGDNITRWTLEDLADDIPIEWFDEGDGPLRITQLLSGGGFLMSPEVLDDLVRDLNPAIRALRKITGGSDAASRAVEATIKGERTLARAVEQMLRNWAKPAALGAPLPIRYAFRVIPEEMLRVAFSGNFENLGTYVAAIASGHLNYDVFGKIIMDSAKAAKERAKLEDLLWEYKVLDQLDPVRDAAEIAKVQKRIAKIEAKNGSRAVIEARISDLNDVINDSLPSAQRALSNNVRGHVEATYDPQVVRSHMERSKVQEVVTRKVADPNNVTTKERMWRRKWVTAQAGDIAEMTINKDYQAVALALKSNNPNALEMVAQSLFQGDLKDVYTEYARNVWGTKPDWDWNTIEAARARVNEIKSDITQRTGLQGDVLDVIATGRLGEDRVLMDKVDHVYLATPEFEQLVRDTLLDNPNAPDSVPYYPNIRTNTKATRNANWMYRSFGLYSKGSAALARNPLWVQAYWQRVAELMPVMDKADAAAIVEATIGKLPDYVIDRLKSGAERATGTMNREEASALASLHARDVTDTLLYNAQNNKSYFAYRHQILFMFFDAYREQWAAWLKLMKNPSNLHKVDILTQQLKEFREPFSKEDNAIIHNDPTTGKQVVTVAATRWLHNLMGGDARLVIPTKNLSLVGSTAPGFSPVVSILASSWNPDSKGWANIKSSMFPFATGEVSVDFRDYLVPQFLQYFAEGVSGVGKRFAPQLDTFWGLLEKIGGPMVERTKKASVTPIMRQLATDVEKYPLTAEGRAQLLDDANALSDNYAIVRSFARAILPAASMTQFFIDTKQGTVVQGVLLDEIRKTENEVMANGGTLTQAVATLLDRYGVGIWAMFGSGSETNVPGLQPTKEYQNWIFKNRKIVDKYPNAGGYLGPQEGEFNSKIFTQQVLINQRAMKDPQTAMTDASNLLAETWYDYQISQIPRGEENTDAAQRFKAQTRYEIENRFPTWNVLGSVGDAQVKSRLQMAEIEKMIQDPDILQTSTGVALKNYMAIRNSSIDKKIAADPENVTLQNWSNENKSSTDLRQYLYDYGNWMAEQTPEFNPIWTNVLMKEFARKDLAAAEVGK